MRRFSGIGQRAGWLRQPEGRQAGEQLLVELAELLGGVGNQGCLSASGLQERAALLDDSTGFFGDLGMSCG